MRSRCTWVLVFIWLFGTFTAAGFAEIVKRTNETGSATISSSQIDAFKAALGKDGFTVTEWNYGQVDVAQLVCNGAMKTGFANNAGGNYLAITNIIQGKNVPSEYQLQPNDAIVIIGRTPPPVAYFSYRSYLYKRQYDGELAPRTLFASLGDMLNNLVIKTEGTADGNPYSQDVIVVSTADKGVDTRVRASAQAAGFSPDIINTDVIPSSVVKLGKGRDSDTFAFLNRLTVPADEQELTDYMQNPGVTVLYLSQKSSAPPLDPFPTPPLRVRGNGITEADLIPPLEALRKAILDNYSGFKATEFTTKVWITEWLDGIQRKKNVLAETRDTIYLRTTADFWLADDPDEFLIIYGVNHQAFGKATYSSFSVYQKEKDLGVKGLNSPDFAKHSIGIIPQGKYAPYLYAIKVARNCGDDPQCIQIEFPEYLQPCNEVDLDRELFVGFRAYLEPATAVGPNPAELLYDQVIKFKKPLR
ncbi:MAG: hypothetical protein HY881_02085 [Deltaproteobacteria bacterium]|nr:hypothetical protein [Deltaproteobacteria bacterium]